MIDAAVPAAGGGLWIRMHVRFGARFAEWLLAAITLGWGIIALWPGQDLFGQPAYAGFRVIFGDAHGLGTIMFLLGVARLGGLIVNGARREVTPWIRVSSAGIGCMIWVGMVAAHSMAGVLGVWAVFYPAFALAEVINAYRAAHDAGESKPHGPA